MTSNAKAFKGRMARRKSQVPFALANALTSTAFDVRQTIIDRTYRAAFTVRNAGFPRAAFRVEKATKRKLVATVFDRLRRPFLKMQATGGIKRSASGRRLAIPTRRIRRSARGKIPTGQRPRAIVQRKAVYIGTVARAAEGIWRQARGGLELLYHLIPTARIRKRFRFYEDAQATARRVFPRRFAEAFRRAMRTAR